VGKGWGGETTEPNAIFEKISTVKGNGGKETPRVIVDIADTFFEVEMERGKGLKMNGTSE